MRQSNQWHSDIFETGCISTDIADEMNMVIVMMPCGTIIPAKCIVNKIVRGGDIVDDTFFQKSLQRPVNRDTVEFGSYFLFNVAVRKCSRMI
jgi:hypothetical protein